VLCYAVLRATIFFGAADLPELDKLVIVSFTDGIDNRLSSLYTGVTQAQMYDHARSDLSKIHEVKSYAIGFESSLNETDMKKIVINGGQYQTASTGNLNQVFQAKYKSGIKRWFL
jgi:hypothetical protein